MLLQAAGLPSALSFELCPGLKRGFWSDLITPAQPRNDRQKMIPGSVNLRCNSE